ncbi:hypothetical protein Pst134EB_010441 [Puccinia striiformis f. sp. tritici]|nr:hypothetical protein Pst134EB_010441 [Puccinia striiformis f. sp. tritici]
MVNKLKKRRQARFKGKPQWIRCFAHVLNLIVQGILRSFGTQKKSKAPNKTRTAPDESDDSSPEGSEAGDVDEQVPKITQAGDDSTSDNEEDESGDEVEQNNQEETEFLSLDNIENPSDKEEFDTYTTIGCKQLRDNTTNLNCWLASPIKRGCIYQSDNRSPIDSYWWSEISTGIEERMSGWVENYE